MTIRFVVPGEPVAKGRPRFGKGRTYTPPQTVAYERSVAWECKAAMAGQKPLIGPVGLEVVVWLSIPPSWPRKRKQAALAGSWHATSRPDADNYAKAVCDGMSGIAFVDDSQIVDLRVLKRYAEKPCVAVTVTSL